MGWGSYGETTGDKARRIAQATQTPTDELLALLIDEVSGLRQDLADERKAAAKRRDEDARRGR